MTLSPEGKCPEIREAVIELQREHEELRLTTKEVCEALRDRLEEAERRVELLSNALRSTLTSRPEPKQEPRPQWSEAPSAVQRDWRPVGDGKYWMPPVGNMVAASEVPPEILERFQREKGTPRPEYPSEEA